MRPCLDADRPDRSAVPGRPELMLDRPHGVLTDALSDVLRSGTETVADVAERVGYRSEAAFSRAFKKVVGTPPSQWRSHRAGESARMSH